MQSRWACRVVVPLGNREMELVEIDIVAAPGKGLAVDGEDDAGDVVDGAGGAVIAGNPLRSGEGERTGDDGQVDIGVVELAGRVGEVGSDLDGRFLGVCGDQSEGE